MNSKYFDAVSIITAIVLVPVVVMTAYAYATGTLSFEQYYTVWGEPVMLLLGFWMRGFASKDY